MNGKLSVQLCNPLGVKLIYWGYLAQQWERLVMIHPQHIACSAFELSPLFPQLFPSHPFLTAKGWGLLKFQLLPCIFIAWFWFCCWFFFWHCRLRRIDAFASVLWFIVMSLHLAERYLKMETPSWLDTAKFGTTSLCCLVGFTAAVATRKSTGQRRYRPRRSEPEQWRWGKEEKSLMNSVRLVLLSPPFIFSPFYYYYFFN